MRNPQHHALGAGLAAFEPASVYPADLTPSGAAGAGQHSPTPQPETQKAGCTRPSADQTKLNAPIVGDSSDDGKVAATLTAQFALLGYSLHALSDGSFLACRWGYSRPLQSMYEAKLLYRQIGGRA